MSSDPTDLIRLIDERHQPVSPRILYCDVCSTKWPCEVRRLRDALRAEQKDFEVIANVLDEERAYSAHLRDEVTRAKEWRGIGVATRFAEFREAQRWAEWFAAERDYHRTRRSIKEIAVERRLTDLVEARAALAEANATIEARDEALMRAGRDNVRLYSTIDHVRFIAQGLDASCTEEVLTALDGAPDPRRVETAEELDSAPAGQRNMWDGFCDDCECIHCKPMDSEPWHGKASS